MAKQRTPWLAIVTRSLLAVVVVAVGFGIFQVLYRTRPEPARSDRADAAPQVEVLPATAVTVRRQWEGFGSVRALRSADVPARVTATVASIPEGIEEGTRVAAGDLIVRLDDTDFTRSVEIITQLLADIDAQLAQLDVEETSWSRRVTLADELVALAEAEFQRVIDARERGGAKQREVDLARQSLVSVVRDQVVTREAFDTITPRRQALEARKAGQTAELAQARANLARTRVTSPLSGVLQSVDVEVGENLTVGQRVARVVDVSRLEVPLRLPASARAAIAIGDPVTLAGVSGNVPIRAAVTRIAPEDDPGTRTMVVYVEVAATPTGAGGLAPGQFVRAVVTGDRSERRVVIPRRALDGDRLLTVEDDHVVGRPVRIAFSLTQRFPELGVADEQWVVLESELAAETLIVTNPSRAISDGLLVRPVLARGTDPGARAKREHSP
ncbi:MAG: efflux RND transporter periplasmic adaptor subunit [Phycisphaerales bacterium]|nr:efflux RND transporter periplasmic adaptor subunit [Phycisphaerales bacterium]